MVEIIAKQEELIMFKKKCQQAIKDIKWEETTTPPPASITEAHQLAKEGSLICKKAVTDLEPQNENFEEWMKYIHLLTCLYNRNRNPKKYTILRTGCY